METVINNRNNIQMKVTEDNVLHIEVDMNVEGAPSSTGKTLSLATTGGFIRLVNAKGKQIMVSLNVNQK